MSESEHFFAPLNWSDTHTNIPVMMNCTQSKHLLKKRTLCPK